MDQRDERRTVAMGRSGAGLGAGGLTIPARSTLFAIAVCVSVVPAAAQEDSGSGGAAADPGGAGGSFEVPPGNAVESRDSGPRTAEIRCANPDQPGAAQGGGDAGAQAPEVFVSPADSASAHRSGAILLDVRSLPQFLVGHPAGAVHTSWRDFSDPDEPGRIDPDDERLGESIGAVGIDGLSPVHVIGDWNEGWGEEGRVYWVLLSAGVPEVRIVSGGFPAWRDADLDTRLGPSIPDGATFAVQRNDTWSATLADVTSGAPITLIDVRTDEEFSGSLDHGVERGGHVPGAIPVPWTTVFAEDGTLLDAEHLSIFFPSQRTSLTTYCTGGVRSAFVFAVLRSAGWSDVRNWGGSWWEYARTNLPAE